MLARKIREARLASPARGPCRRRQISAIRALRAIPSCYCPPDMDSTFTYRRVCVIFG